jgi:hypothetical protein
MLRKESSIKNKCAQLIAVLLGPEVPAESIPSVAKKGV